VEPVERHPAAPARIEGLGKEDAVAGANHRLLIPRIRDAEARREPLLPGLFREFSAEARRTLIVAGKRHAARTSHPAALRAAALATTGSKNEKRLNFSRNGVKTSQRRP